MTDLLRLGTYSIQALQLGLSTTGHNIANASTEGYSKQTVNFETQSPTQYGFGFIGSGARVASVERAFNGFLTDQVRSLTSSANQQEVFSELSAQLENLFANNESNLNNYLQNFFDSMSSVTANPTGMPEREVLLGNARSLVDRFQSNRSLMQDINESINDELTKAVAEINNLADDMVSLNEQIVRTSNSGTGVAPNDLLDQRDKVLEQMAEYLDIQVVEQNDGSVNVAIGNGLAIVVGSTANKLKTVLNSADGSKVEIGLLAQAGTSDGSPVVQGGKLQGLLDFRSRVLEPVESELGAIALSLTDSFNTQHGLGVDLNGNLGSSFFQPLSFSIANSTDNAGTAAPTVTVTDASLVRPSAYDLRFDGAQWQLTRQSDGSSVTGVGVLSLDGMSVDTSAGVPVGGDKFVFNPGRQAGSQFAMALSDPARVAAANALHGQNPVANTGTGVLSAVRPDPVNTLPLAGPITLTFDPDALGPGVPGFNVTGGPGGTIAYDPATESGGKAFNFAAEGVHFEISGQPQTGDSFVVANNTTALGDSANMLALAGLQDQRLVNGDSETFQGMFGVTVTRVGTNSSDAIRNLSIETTLRDQAVSQRENDRGVNLDEEAANLLRLQQAYQASAQLIKISDELFQVLISSTR